MATIVVYGGGFQPFHEGHLSSYLQAKKAFPDAVFYVAASNDVKQRPIPFKDKQFLAQQAGVVDPMIETKNPINPQEILAQYDPQKDVYIMVRSERDPVGYTKKDGSPAYYQPYVKGQPLAPFSQHGYVFVTKKHNFTVDGEEVYSGSQVRSMYSSSDDTGRMKIIQQLYPKSKQQQMIKRLLDKYLVSSQETTAMPTKTTAMSKLKNKQLAEQIRKMRPLLKEASPAMKLKFMKLMKTAISENVVAEATFKKNPYGRTAASQQRARELLNPPKPPEPKKDEQGVAEGLSESLVSKIEELGMIGRIEYMGPDYNMPYRATLQDKTTGKVWHSDFNDGKTAEDWLVDTLSKYEQWKNKHQGVAEGYQSAKTIEQIKFWYKDAANAEAMAKAAESLNMNGMYDETIKKYKQQAQVSLSKANGLKQGVAEGAPIVVAQAPIDIRNPKKAPQSYRNQGDIVPDTKPPSTEKRGVKGRAGQRPMPTYEDEVDEAKLSTMRDYFAGNKDAKDPTKLSQMRDYFNKIDSTKKSTVKPEIMKRKEPSVAESNVTESSDYLDEK